MEKCLFVDQCWGLEHAAGSNREPVELLEDGCDMSIVSVIFENTYKSILNKLQLVCVD